MIARVPRLKIIRATEKYCLEHTLAQANHHIFCVCDISYKVQKIDLSYYYYW